METIGTLLKSSREHRGLSKRAAAKTIGVTSPTYDAWESDYHKPKGPGHAERIAEFVDKPTWVILDLAGLLDERSAAILKQHIPGQHKTAGRTPIRGANPRLAAAV